MKLSEIMKNGRTAFTFEIFPPKKDMPIETIYKTLDGLQGLRPDFISVTYGAGGSAADTKTADIAEIIEKKYSIASAVHLTCLYNTKEDIDLICEQLKARGYSVVGTVSKGVTAGKIAGKRWKSPDTYYTIRDKVISGSQIDEARIEKGMRIWMKKCRLWKLS